MKRIISGLLVIISLGFGTIIFSGLGSENTLDTFLAEEHLDNFDLLINLSLAGKNSLRAAEAEPDRYQQKRMIGEITDSVDLNHALILSYDGTEIPIFLSDNFDRIFGITADYFNIDYRNERVVVWMVDFETLQGIPAGAESCFKRCPTTIGALYAPIFNYLLFTPQYINDYYVTHELLHYFIDQDEELIATRLPEIIARKYEVGAPLLNYLKKNEEIVVIELSKIIILKNLAPQLLGLRKTCADCHTSETLLASLAIKEAVLEGGDPAVLRPKIAKPERFLVSEAFFDEIHGEISCVECHQGQSPGDMESAHQGLIRDPSIDGAACQGCHADIVSNYATSLHNTLQGQISTIDARSRPGTMASELAELNEIDCSTCHATCGQCHISRPDPVRGGLIEGHQFLKEPPMSETCAHCHEASKEGGLYLAEYGVGDVHQIEAKMSCIDCHRGTELHGSGVVYTSRYEVQELPRCTDCHVGEELAQTQSHSVHRDKLSCYVCHSGGPVQTCFGCHEGYQDYPTYRTTEKTEYIFKIGLNPNPTEMHPYQYVTVRHIPTLPDTFSYFGVELSNFDQLPTWKMSTPHNIQKKTPQNRSCDSCHGHPELFLTEEDLGPNASKADQKVTVPFPPE